MKLAYCLVNWAESRKLNVSAIENACEAKLEADRKLNGLTDSAAQWQLTSLTNQEKAGVYKAREKAARQFGGQITIVSKFIAHSRSLATIEKRDGALELSSIPALFAEWLTSKEGFKAVPVPAPEKAVKAPKAVKA